MKILIGIVLFHPDPDRFRQNMEALAPQLSPDMTLAFADNGTDNAEKQRILSILKETLPQENLRTLVFRENNRNIGVAASLRWIMREACQREASWVLTLDQDSVAAPELLEQYAKAALLPEDAGSGPAGAYTCIIKDRNFSVTGSPAEDSVTEVENCITAGCFMRVDAYRRTPGYEARLFIDFVDTDICYSLQEAGYRILRIPYEGLLHEVGHGRNVPFLGTRQIVYNQQTWRRYYIVRNELYLARKHPHVSMTRTALRVARNMLLVFLYEDGRREKLRLGLLGARDAFRMSCQENAKVV